ncbi:SIS domain-containing protein [Herbiconiux sp. A18JL235]|uniref:SIS domain-containing protein n=1 Tax=Herbiconiux sp. A18JL235 TaxID=3152363 RepID=A0AB39BDP1_9MICO
MNHRDHLLSVIDALTATGDVVPADTRPVEGAVVVGSGDSLSSALLAQAFGHRALSSGDITFLGRLPVGTQTVVGISHSGTSGATVQALRLAREAGVRTVAVTSNAGSPLADAADEVQLVPTLAVDEVVPCAGHLMLGLGVAAVCGVQTRGATSALSTRLRDLAPVVDGAVAALGDTAPRGISVLSLPDLRGAADFWMLKLIEATGVPTRSVALEESGHVDYFIGPEAHLEVQLVGAYGEARHERLARALESTGQTVLPVHIAGDGPDADARDRLLHELAGAVVGTVVAEAAASRWNRPPFRGGAVNMDASHIKLDGQPVA